MCVCVFQDAADAVSSKTAAEKETKAAQNTVSKLTKETDKFANSETARKELTSKVASLDKELGAKVHENKKLMKEVGESNTSLTRTTIELKNSWTVQPPNWKKRLKPSLQTLKPSKKNWQTPQPN